MRLVSGTANNLQAAVTSIMRATAPDIENQQQGGSTKAVTRDSHRGQSS